MPKSESSLLARNASTSSSRRYPDPAAVRAILQQLARCPQPITRGDICAHDWLVAAIETGAVDALQLRSDADAATTRWWIHLAHPIAPALDLANDAPETRAGWRLLSEWRAAVALAERWQASGLVMLFLDGYQPRAYFDGAVGVWRPAPRE